MRTFRFDGIKDITSYTSISEWIYNINPEWNVSAGFSLDDLWSKPEKLTLECVSTLMYLSYCGNSPFIEIILFFGRNIYFYSGLLMCAVGI